MTKAELIAKVNRLEIELDKRAKLIESGSNQIKRLNDKIKALSGHGASEKRPNTSVKQSPQKGEKDAEKSISTNFKHFGQ